ncbi:Brp/Blh family beta-carotene 15,15'-dioxygenase [Micromonospora halophytica]|uniref:Probable beta-carotene 15,15'-dioxygenase n=1 Tax=Micromonospora halophytica TaxID=47864 RepID=A0A1C5GKQ2_9ACTN|nr:Brp/Blh family beta-carotene 15,15'-dioxygenase [Micromonospora halophytica]SCG34343.1 beta-carotene 15,15'-monooxygenase, Brp/Blh family [Micromonospora halophytica]
MLVRIGVTSPLPALALLVLAPVLHRHDVGGAPGFLLAGLLLGLPHGAVDHLVPAWMSARARPTAARLAVPLGYAALAGAALVAFRAAPAPALVGFLALSVAHFGTADEAFHAERDGRPVRQPLSGVLARGGPPVVVPLLLWPDAVDPVLATVAPRVPELLTVEVRALATACLLAAVARTVLRDVRAGRRADAAEPVLLLCLFAAVPPALAIGVYFATWHSARHVARLLHGDPGNRADLVAGRLGPPLRRFARRAALPTLAAAAALAVLAAGPVDLLPATVAVLAALTVPHAALVAWLDRRARPRHPSEPEG